MGYFICAILYPEIKGQESILLNQTFRWCSDIPTWFFHVFFGAHNNLFIKLIAGYPVKIRGLFLFLTELVTLLAIFNYITILD